MNRRTTARPLLLTLLSAAAILPTACRKSATVSPATATAPAAGLQVDRTARTVTIPAVVAEQGRYRQLGGAIEYVLVGAGGKEYESLFVTDAPARAIHDALRSLGLPTGQPGGQGAAPRGLPVEVFVQVRQGPGWVDKPIDGFISHVPPEVAASDSPGEKWRLGTPLAPGRWTFTGSLATTDPDTGEEILQAELTRGVIGLYSTDASPLVQNPRPEAAAGNVYFANMDALPAAGEAVRIVFRRPAPHPAAGARRTRVIATGRVQGIGYESFVAGQARRRQVNGFVRPLPGGRVEALLEGPAEAVGELLETMRSGPRGARVETLDLTDEPPEGDLENFEIWQ